MRRVIKLIYNGKSVGEIYAEAKEPWSSIQMRAFQKLEMDAISASSRLFGVKLQRDKLKLEEKVIA